MLTKTDLKLIRVLMEEMKDEIVKRTDINMDKKIDTLRNEMNHEFAKVRKELAETKVELKNDIVTFKDEIIGEIRDIQIDSEVIRSYSDRLENHDSRITKLEQSSS